MNQTIEAIEEKEAPQSAQINQKIGLSVILGECHGRNVHHIAEYIPGRNQYRLKTVSYRYFESENALKNYCGEHKAELIQEHETQLKGKKWPIEFGRKQQKRKTVERETRSPEAQEFGLSERQLRFCKEYLLSRNATQAYTISHPSVKNANSASACASYLLKKPQVKAYLEKNGIR